MLRRKLLWVIVLSLGAASGAGVGAQSGSSGEKVIIRAAKPYGALVSRVQALGGTVTYQYKYIDAIAAVVPGNAMGSLKGYVGTAAITKDEEIALPRSVDTHRGKGGLSGADGKNVDVAAEYKAMTASDVAAQATASPNGYLLNGVIANVMPLHTLGIAGQGIVVAVIDSGIRPGFPHISSDGSVIGCEDLVGDALGCSNFGNDGHGTFVAGMISANVAFTFSTASVFRNAVLAECPSCFSNAANTTIPMLGTAPLSSIYALRVFPATGGAPNSRILAAVERAIELREMFNNGTPGGVKVGVVNMSLGGSTTFAGRDLFDTMVDQLIAHDIVPVIAAGNAGPSSLTMGSPASAFSAITVGAASLPHNERILRRNQFGQIVGSLYRPFLGAQTSFFSSRGPNADGRPDPDVIANGFACYGQGLGATTGSISLGSGTSFASPSVAGVAALLRQAFPTATARQIRNAIIATGNPNVLSDGSTYLDQGHGYVDGLAAANLLATGTVPDTLPAPGNYSADVKVNVEQNTFLNVRNGFINEHASNLLPGQRNDVLYRVQPNTRQVLIVLHGVTPSLPPAQQNQLFGDDILLTVHTAKTSSIGEGDYRVFAFTLGGALVINDPEPGLMRITINGDWTNAGTISADLSVQSLTEPIPQFTTQGKLDDQEFLVFPVQIPAGVAQAEFRLSWLEDWGSYPSSDIDLILINPANALNFSGATENSPEVAAIANPLPGTWLAIVNGFQIHAGSDKYELRVSLDGKVLK